jgi:hypothetical protein
VAKTGRLAKIGPAAGAAVRAAKVGANVVAAKAGEATVVAIRVPGEAVVPVTAGPKVRLRSNSKS